MAEKRELEVQKVVVVGAGPVGALAALYAGKRGDEVHVYELRDDLRNASTTPLNFTKSINLALSERGINSIRQAQCEGLLEDVLAETIPMHARMIHGRRKTGEIYEESQAYDANGRCILAVDRASLNKRILDALEKMPNVTLHFNHKLTGADFNKKTAWFEEQRPRKNDHPQNPTQPPSEQPIPERPTETAVNFDLLIGADGAHSATRYHMMKYARVNYTQSYIVTLWCEFRIAPSSNSTFAMSPHHLHIWPAGSMMFIAIPSLDHSFTCTLFAPSAHFETLASNPSLLLPQFFNTHFPGVIPDLIPEHDLIKQFTSSPHLPLISIKCSPYHYASSCVILGDAAHAMVPFYGQGMNAGLEDVRVLFDFLDAHGVYPTNNPSPNKPPNTTPPSPPKKPSRTPSLASALTSYTLHRTPDAHTINDLALYNYIEMSIGVQNPLYKLRKYIEESAEVWCPWLGWRTQYARVSFGNERYSVVRREVGRQGEILWRGLVGLGIGVGVGVGVLGAFGWDRWGWGRWGGG